MTRPRVSETLQQPTASEKQTRPSAAPTLQPDLTTGQRSMLAAQQSAGNQAVMRRMAAQSQPAVQRAVQIDEISTNVSDVNPAASDTTGMVAPSGATDPASSGGSISGAGGSVNVDGSGVAINSNGPISLNAPMVTATGPVQTPVLMADSVVASSYTPGAGNVW